MKQNFIFIILFSLLVPLASISSAIQQPGVMYHDSRPLALGGTFTAIADDVNALFYNPAGLASWGRKKTSLAKAYFIDPSAWKPRYNNIGDFTVFAVNNRVNIALLDAQHQQAVATLFKLGILPGDMITNINSTVHFVKKFFTAYSLLSFLNPIKIDPIQTNAGHYGFGNLTSDQLKEFNSAVQTLSSSAISSSIDADIISYVRHYFGFGFFTSVDMSMILGMQGIMPDIKLNTKIDSIFAAGFGIPMPNVKKLSVGATFKYFNRFLVKTETWDDYLTFTSLDYNTFLDSIDYKKDMFDLVLHGPTLSENLPSSVYAGTGMGFDLGAMYQLTRTIKLGLMLNDVYTKINWWDNKPNSIIPMNGRLGIAYKPDFEIWGLFQDPLLAFDMDDIFWRNSRSFWLKTHFGAEFKFLFKLLNIKLGLNQGYLTYGAGLDFSFYWLSKIPLIGWLRPDGIYFPQFNPNRKDFLQHNPCCGLVSTLLSPLLYGHIKLDVLSYTRELGSYVGAIPDKQLSVRASLSYSY